jgi:hypothetical protein
VLFFQGSWPGLLERLCVVAPFIFREPLMGLLKLETVALKNSQLTEKWVQNQLAENPTLLGLGDLVLKGFEKIQPHAGRLDLLLQDPETLKRYEVEIQLGATDESHIIRTVEYWDIERKRYPQYEHAAVIVAEDITSRFLNVIQLFNGAIPLIALKMTAYKVGDDYALTFVKVMDELTYGLDDEDEAGAVLADRAYWEKRSPKEALVAIDDMLKLVNEVEPKAALRYVKNAIGIEAGGLPLQFLWFIPRKACVLLQIKLPQSKEADEQLKDAGIDAQMKGPGYQLRIVGGVNDKQRGVLVNLIRRASDAYGKA